MENQKISTTGVILLILASASTVILPKTFPDISIIALLYLSLKYETPALLFWAFLSGLVHDGFNIDKIWVSPIVFPVLTLSTNWAKSNFNLTFAPAKLIFVTSFVTLSFVIYSLFWNINLMAIGFKFILTLALAIITAFLV
ncbi:MAG: hypothetical protein QMD82_02435 [bacterium]|nr:hypothetical protein [bacterium]